jgi:acetolactate synthase-1/2/3 large subunit
MTTGARFLAESLKGYGVTHVFYVPAIVNRALVEMERLGITRVMTHGEKSAAYMADGYARTGRKPGVCMAQSVGAANLAAGLQDPYLGHSPVLAITGRKPAVARYRNAYQEIDHRQMFESVTKYNVEVDSVEQLPYLICQAFREMTSGTPGPAHLDLDGYAGDRICSAEADLKLVVQERHRTIPPFRPTPDRDLIEEAAALLSSADRAVIIAGAGVRMSCAQEELLRFAGRLSIPVATSVDGKGVIPEMHDLCLGSVGSYGRSCANQVVSQADVVLFVGCGIGDQVTCTWTLPRQTARVIQIDIEPTQLGRNYPGTLGIAGDAKLSIGLLDEVLKPKNAQRSWRKQCAGIVRSWRQEVKQKRRSGAIPIVAERLCGDLEQVLPENAILISDTGYSAIWSATHIGINSSQQTYLRAAGSLGWAFPAALGAKCAAPHRPVICFTGDGALFYHVGELETAKRYGINTVTVVNNNSMYSQTIHGVEAAYGQRTGKKSELYCFSDLQISRIAETMGCVGMRVEKPDQILPALTEALRLDSPVVVDVVTDGLNPAPWTALPEGSVSLA